MLCSASGEGPWAYSWDSHSPSLFRPRFSTPHPFHVSLLALSVGSFQGAFVWSLNFCFCFIIIIFLICLLPQPFLVLVWMSNAIFCPGLISLSTLIPTHSVSMTTQPQHPPHSSLAVDAGSRWLAGPQCRPLCSSFSTQPCRNCVPSPAPPPLQPAGAHAFPLPPSIVCVLHDSGLFVGLRFPKGSSLQTFTQPVKESSLTQGHALAP